MPHHYDSFPPRSYGDLRSADIRHITAAFVPSPTSSTPAPSSNYKQLVQAAVADLPWYLRCKLPLLSTFCSVHNKISPLPVIDILKVYQAQASAVNIAKWRAIVKNDPSHQPRLALLEDMNAIWMSPAEFHAKFGRDPLRDDIWAFHKHKCAACKLSIIARSVPAIAALGSCIIPYVSPHNWRRSKRIRIVEEWIRAVVPNPVLGEDAIRKMWETGSELRAWLPDTKYHDPGRGYIDEFAARATPSRADSQPRSSRSGHPRADSHATAYGTSTTPTRPSRRPSQDDHVALVHERMADHAFQDYPPEANPFSAEADPEQVMDWLFDDAPPERRVASSVYTRHPMQWDVRSVTGTQIIESYRERTSVFGEGPMSGRSFF